MTNPKINKRNNSEEIPIINWEKLQVNNKVSQKVKQFYSKNQLNEIQSESASSDFSKEESATPSKQKWSQVEKLAKKLERIDSRRFFDINLKDSHEIQMVKSLLLNHIQATNNLNKHLEKRLKELDKIISMFDKRVELDTGVVIKHTDLTTLKYYLSQISNNLLNYTKKEIELDIQKRENDIRNKQLNLLQNQYNHLKERWSSILNELEWL